MDANGIPSVSVIVPSHNRARLLREALASVCGQEGAGQRFAMEVIVVDDGSTDATPDVVHQFAGIKYIRLETNRGLPSARNVGIKASAGKYVAFIDDDDLWLPYKLALQVPVLEAHPDVGVLYGQVIVRFGDAVYVWPKARTAQSGWVFHALLKGSFIAPSSILVRREAYEKAGYFDESLRSNVDYDMSLRLAFHFPFKFVPGPVGIYRLSKQGAFLTAVAEERIALERVVEKALAMLPATARDRQQVSREARARAALRIAGLLAMVGDLARMRSQLLKALEEFPWIAGEPWARSWIADNVPRLALASDSPITAVRVFCTDARAAVGAGTLRERWWVRKLLAQAWTGAARALGHADRRRAGGYAAVCAVLLDPTQLRRKAVVKNLGRAVLAVLRGRP